MRSALYFLLLLLVVAPLSAAPITYQGQLQQGGQLVNDTPVTMEFLLFAAESGGDPLEDVQKSVTPHNGLFQVELDFGAEAFDGNDRFLEIRVDGSPLIPRQRVTATPYALLAGDLVGGLSATAWSLAGNAGTSSATNFLGTTDNQALELRTANVRSLRIEPSAVLFNDLPITANVIAGSHANWVTPNVRGATIAGGGVVDELNSDPQHILEAPNRVTDNYGTVGGGYDNQAGDGAGTTSDRAFATVGGGRRNTASSSASTVGGGANNTASRLYSTVGGGLSNTASGTASSVGGGFDNCAGGRYSWAGGNNAKVRPGSQSGPPGDGCLGITSTGTNGDEGTFIWADYSQNTNFISTGSNQFLVRAAGGMVLQRSSSTDDQARRPRGTFNVVREPSGLAQPTNPGSSVLAVFENDNGGNVFVVAGGTDNKGYRFGTPDSLFHGGILYSPNGDMLFRNNNNLQRMAIRPNGEIEINVLATGAGTALCRNGQNRISDCSSSSQRYKQGIETLDGDEAVQLLKALRPVRYHWIDDGRADIGLVAEEVADIIPDIVTYNRDGQIEGFEYNRLGPLLVAGFQEQKFATAARFAELAAENAELRAEVAVLKVQSGQVHELEARLATLEAFLIEDRQVAERSQ